MRRLAAISVVVIALLSPGTAYAASVSWASSFSVQTDSFGSEGQVIYTSGTANFLRAQAHGSLFQTFPIITVVSVRAGTITSSGLRYGGANGGRVTWTVNGNFSRTLSGGFSLLSGAWFTHTIRFELVDVSQSNKILGTWTYMNDKILCGGIAYPIGAGGCDNAPSDTIGNGLTLNTTNSSVRNGDTLKLRVRVTSTISGAGFVIGLDGRTQANGMTGSITW
jgi:hypothetical protein